MTDPPRIVLVDDDAQQLHDLETAVRAVRDASDFEIVAWQPKRTEADVASTFATLVEPGAALVVTDYDLTRSGPPGFFGLSIVAWCQRRAIPVGDYSRGTPAALPNEPNLFEFRMPTVAREAAPRIVAIAKGFVEIAAGIEARPDLLSTPSPASMLAALLDRPEAVTNLSLYDLQIGANGSLIGLLRNDHSPARRKAIAAYVLGHLLFNSIMRFPGPLLDEQALCAYFACAPVEAGRVRNACADATYRGPFCELRPFHWRDRVDQLVEDWADDFDIPFQGDLAGYRRSLLEAKVGAPPLRRFDCPRCAGERGGYLCPFTGAVVCERDDCSVASSGWVPQGADVARVERTFYDETSPMMGI